MAVIKGKVLRVDEEETMLTYEVEVVKIIQQPKKGLKIRKENPTNNKEIDVIDLVKRAACRSPKLKEKEEYLFMGLDIGRRYHLDETSFVKQWPTEPGDPDKKSDKEKLDTFAQQHSC